MQSLILMAIIFFAVNRLAKSAKGKGKGANRQTQQPNSRQQQAIEEQRRRRAVYEEMQRQRAEQVNKQQMERMFGTGEDEDKHKDEHEVEAYEPHHIDEEEERRCAEAEAKKAKERKIKVSQQTLKRELLQRYGSLEQPESQKPRPQSLQQAQQQLYTPAAAPLTTQVVSPIKTRAASAQDLTPESLGLRNLGLKSNTWVQGIVMAEILGPPRAKKRQVR